MMTATTKLGSVASRGSTIDAGHEITASVSALGILIVGVLLLITGGGPPI